MYNYIYTRIQIYIYIYIHVYKFICTYIYMLFYVLDMYRFIHIWYDLLDILGIGSCRECKYVTAYVTIYVTIDSIDMATTITCNHEWYKYIIGIINEVELIMGHHLVP